MSAHQLENRLANLKIHIAQLEREVAILEAECSTIENDLAQFRLRYNQLIKPLNEQIEAAKAAIEKLRDLQLMQQMGENLTLESLWKGSKRKSQRKNTQDSSPIEDLPFTMPPTPKEQRIKTLYRELARRYHPDLACDEADRERRTRLMSMINTAYQEKDFDALQALVESKAQQQNEVFSSEEPLRMLILHRLQQQQLDLSVKLRDLKEYLHDLRYGPMMELKLQDSLAKARGEDLLEKLAEDMQRDYWRYMKELEKLRQEVN